MSSVPRVNYVVEGVTDFIVLDAIVERILGHPDYIATQIQPPESEYAGNQGPLGGGWKGVLSWCATEAAIADGFASGMTVANCDCLVIHVDADIAHEPELSTERLGAPCPPARNTCNRVRAYIKRLLGDGIPAKVVLCVPAQCTEAWVFSSLHPSEAAKRKDLECREEIERLLIGKPNRLVRDKGGSAKKQTDRYRNALGKITVGWMNAVRLCPEAERFNEDCLTALVATGLRK